MTQPANKRLLTEDQAAALSSAAPAAPSVVASGGSAITVSRSDHVHSAAGLFGNYGDGSDGDMNFDGTNTFSGKASKSGNVYTLDRSILANDMTISAGVTVRPAGNLIGVLGTLSGAGTIAALAGVTRSSRYGVLRPGAVGPAGGAGAGTAGVASDNNLGVGSNTAGVPAGGGAGGLGTGGAGGGGGGNSSDFTLNGLLKFSLRLPAVAFTGVVPLSDWAVGSPLSLLAMVAGGASGGAGGGGSGNGGKGGDGGQVVIVNARRITGTLTITAAAEAGGNAVGTNAGGGGGGQGGLVVLNTTSTTGWTGSLSAAGGAGGTKLGTGVAGVAGAAGFTHLNVWA